MKWSRIRHMTIGVVHFFWSRRVHMSRKSVQIDIKDTLDIRASETKQFFSTKVKQNAHILCINL